MRLKKQIKRIVALTMACVIGVTSQGTQTQAISAGLSSLKFVKDEVMDFGEVSDKVLTSYELIKIKTEDLKKNYSYKKSKELFDIVEKSIKELSATDIKQIKEEYTKQLDGEKAFRYKVTPYVYAISSIFYYGTKNLSDAEMKKHLESMLQRTYEIAMLEFKKNITPSTLLYLLDSICYVSEYHELDKYYMGHAKGVIETEIANMEMSGKGSAYNFKTKNLKDGLDKYIESKKLYERMAETRNTKPTNVAKPKPVITPAPAEQNDRISQEYEKEMKKIMKKMKQEQAKYQAEINLENMDNSSNSSGDGIGTSDTSSSTGTSNTENKNSNISPSGKYAIEYSLNKSDKNSYERITNIIKDSVSANDILTVLSSIKDAGTIIEDTDAFMFLIDNKLTVITLDGTRYDNEKLQNLFSIYPNFSLRIVKA